MGISNYTCNYSTGQMAGVSKMASSYQFLLLPTALGLLLPSLIMPWVTLDLFGTYNLSPIDLLFSSSDGADAGNSPDLIREHPEIIFHDLVRSYKATSLYIISMATFLAAIVGINLSIPMKNQQRMLVALIAGTLAITSAIAWFLLMDSIKNNLAQQAALTGGLIGEEFKGNERDLADRILKVGIGPLVIIPAGGTGISYYFIQKRLNMSSAIRK